MIVAPSLLSANFAHLARDIDRLNEAGCQMLHLDIMDGHFVPNISFGSSIVKTLRPLTKMVFDVHLMISEPDRYIDAFKDAGADIITVHAEASTHLDRSVSKIRQLGIKAGVSLNPSTHESCLDYVIDKIDMVLIMTVNPGYGGQSFIEEMVDKISRVKKTITERNLNVDIEVDGGINHKTVAKVTEAGANILVAGSAFFGSENPSEFVRVLKERGYGK